LGSVIKRAALSAELSDELKDMFRAEHDAADVEADPINARRRWQIAIERRYLKSSAQRER